jgi:ADP-ribosylglycohydrolase
MNFEEGCLLAVNLGDDADSTGAVYGQIAGAYYGETGIPTKWIKKLVKYDLITDLTNKLIDASNQQSI